MNVTLRQLRVFASVARLLSFTRAAQELHLTQPAVSMQIKQLESIIGLKLFEHIGKKVFLTEAGQEMFRHTRSIAHELEELENTLAGLKGLERGRLRVSVATTANYFVPTLLAEFCKHHEKITVSLDVTNRKTLLRQLNENETDLAIMGQPPTGSDLDAAAFLENPLVIIAPPNHPLARKKNIPLKRLEQEVFLVREPGSGTRDALERFFQQHRIHITTGMEIGSNEAIKQSVEAGLGLGLLSRDTLEMELSLKRLNILDVENFPIQRHWYVVHRKGKQLSTVARVFREFLLSEAQKTLHKSKKSTRKDGVF